MYQDDRLEQIFRCIVDSYVKTAQPVGSKIVSQMYEGSLSPASIRNVMAVLESMGLIEQPHTSAGRIPTARGYRYYVNRFMQFDTYLQDYDSELEEIMSKISDIEHVAELVVHQLSEWTDNAGVMFVKNVRRRSTIFEDFGIGIPEEASQLTARIYVDGASKVLRQPEFADINCARSLLSLFEAKQQLMEMFEKDLDLDSTHIYIGSETQSNSDGISYDNVSIVVKRYSYRDRPVGCLGVIGPSRMHYDRAVGVVNTLADRLTDVLNQF